MFGDEQETYIDLATLRLADGACEELAMRCELLRSAFAAVIARLDTFAPANHAIFGDCEGTGLVASRSRCGPSADGIADRDPRTASLGADRVRRDLPAHRGRLCAG